MLPLVEVVEVVVVRREDEGQGEDDLAVDVTDGDDDGLFLLLNFGGCRCSSGMVNDDGGILDDDYFNWLLNRCKRGANVGEGNDG